MAVVVQDKITNVRYGTELNNGGHFHNAGEGAGLQDFELDRSEPSVKGIEIQKDSDKFSRREVVGAVANFVNTAVGAGVIAVPFALHKTGFFVGIFLILVAASLVYSGSCYLVKCGLKVGTMDYSQIMEVAFGRIGYYGFSFMVSAFLFGVLSAYMIIIGDNWPAFAREANLGYFFESRALSTFFLALISLPLSLFKDMQALSWASSIGLISVIIIDVIIIAYTPSSLQSHPEPLADRLSFCHPRSLFSGLGIISFSMVSQHATYHIYTSVKNCSYPRWKFVSWISICIEVFFVMTIGVAGYISFGDSVHSDVLENYSGDVVVNAGRVLLSILMAVTYPMAMFVLRNVFDQMVFERYLGYGPPGNLRHYSVTIALWVCSVGLAILVADLGVVLGVIGSIGASSLAYLFPSMLYMKFYRHEIVDTYNKLLDRKQWGAITLIDRLKMASGIFVPTAMLVFSVISMVAGTVTSFI